MGAPDTSEENRQRWQGWLQTTAFIGALAVLAVVFYTSSVIQANRKAAERREATGVIQTRDRATAAIATATAEVRAVQQTMAEAERQSRQSTPVTAGGEMISRENIDRVETLARWGRGVLRSVAWSPDGQMLAVGTSLGVDVYSWPSRELIRHLEIRAEYRSHLVIYDENGLELPVFAPGSIPPGVSSLAFSPDRQTLAVVLSDGTVQLWQLSSGTLLDRVTELPGRPDWLSFSEKGLQLVGIEPWSGEAWLWQNGRGLDRFPFQLAEHPTDMDFDTSSSGRVEYPAVAGLSPSGAVMAIGWRNIVDIRQTAGGKLVRTFRLGVPADWLLFSPDEEVLVVGSSWGLVQLWSVVDGTLLKTVQDSECGMSGLALSADGRQLAGVGGCDGLLPVLWSLPDGQPEKIVESDLSSHWSRDIYSDQTIAFSPDGEVLAIIASDLGAVKLWQTDDGQALLPLSGYGTPVLQVVFSPDGRSLLANEVGTDLWLWEMGRGIPRAVYRRAGPDHRHLEAATFSADGSMIISTVNETVQFWRVADETAVRSEPWPIAFKSGLEIVAFSPGGDWVAAGGISRQAYVWQTTDERSLHTLGVSQDGTCALAFSPDGRFLAVGTGNRQIDLWQVEEGKWLMRNKDGEELIFSIAWSSDGRLLALARERGVELRQADDLELVYALPFSTTRELAFSPDGRLLVAGSPDGTVRLLDVDRGTMLRVLEGPTSVLSLAFSPNGRLLAAASHDGTIWVWGVAAPPRP